MVHCSLISLGVHLLCVVRVRNNSFSQATGLTNEIEKCSVVAVGSGTLVIDTASMKTDGSAINDCTG